jgi:hypothetical protein
MKRLFDKIYFSAELLSSETILSGQQNIIRFLISDAIANTEIKNIEFRLRMVDRTEKTLATLIEWTAFTETINEDIFEIEITPTFTAPTDTTTKVIADIKIIDIDDNTFYIQNNTFKIKVL